MASDPIIGSIFLFGFDWAPEGYLVCAGQELPVQPNAALFSLLGNRFGGNGSTTFKLPDLRGRVVMGQGQGAGLNNHPFAQASGTETNTLTLPNMAPQALNVPLSLPVNLNANLPVTTTLKAKASATTGNSADPTGAYMANTGASDKEYTNLSTAATAEMAAQTATGTAAGTITGAVTGALTATIGGSSTPVNNLQPFLALNYSIVTNGIYPTRP